MELAEAPASALSTIEHIQSDASQSRLAELIAKWPKYRIDKRDHKWWDLSDCEMFGLGGHEIVVFTPPRHMRLARLTGDEAFPVWFAVGQHFSNNWHDAQGKPYDAVEAISITRGITEAASFAEPLKMLAIGSCRNGRFAYDETLRRVGLATDPQVDQQTIGNPRFRRLTIAPTALIAALREAVALPAPTLQPIAPRDGLMFSIGIEEIMQRDAERRAVPDVDCPTFGRGAEVVYAYTFAAIFDAATRAGDAFFPVKIGYTRIHPEEHRSACHAALLRIVDQIILDERVRLLALLRCDAGRATEKEIHRFFMARKIRCPAREWFATNGPEVDAAFRNLAGRLDSERRPN